MARTYEYTERPAGVILGRRGLFKVIGLCAVGAAGTGTAVKTMLDDRNCVLIARQKGLYKDDLLCQNLNLTSSHQNPVIKKIYDDLKASPMNDKMYGLLHTHFAHRSALPLSKHH